MADVEAPVASAAPESTEADAIVPKKDALVARLDELLERYLNTLDEYTQAREQHSKTLSSGYLSLAQANFHKTSTGQQYGRDHYDGRMQALRKVHVAVDNASQVDEAGLNFSIALEQEEKEDEKPTDKILTFVDGEYKIAKTEIKAEQKPEDKILEFRDGEYRPKIRADTPASTSQTAVTSDAAKDTVGNGGHSAADEPKEPSEKVLKSKDPLRWFGILVPPALRSAQSSFISAVEGPMPQVVTLASKLRRQEIEIGRVKKQIKKL